MDHPVKVAFCPLLFEVNGGRFTAKGLPILDPEERIRGKCDRAFDCGQCAILANWVTKRMEVGWLVGWECSLCLKQTKKIARELPGFYQAGRKAVPPEHQDYDPDKPALEGCTRCGWESSFLQLVLRKESAPYGPESDT